MMAFNKSVDQDVIDEHNAAPAVTQRKQAYNARRWREALEAFDRQQMLHGYGLNSWELDDD